MSDVDSLPFSYPSEANLGAAPKKCRRHEWEYTGIIEDRPEHPEGGLRILGCRRCGKVRDETAAARGRRNRSRGNRIQRQRVTGLGGRNLAGNNPNLDGLGAMFAYESKSGGFFSERTWRVLDGIPKRGRETGVLIVTEAPGPGHKARSYVVVEYDEWKDLHGEETP